MHAEEGINGKESANIVGYQQTAVSNGYSFATVTFKNVGATSDEQYIDLLDIVPLDKNGNPFAAIPKDGTVCAGAITIHRMGNSDGSYGTEYRYYSSKSGSTVLGWQVGQKTATVNRGDVIFKKGEGIIVYCSLAGGAKFQVSGEVELKDMAFAIGNGYSFTGNNTPVAVDLVDIVPLDKNGNPFAAIPKDGTVCAGAITIHRMGNSDGSYGTEYRYYSSKSGSTVLGWQVGQKTATVNRGDVVLAPGEGIIVYCSLAGGAQFQMPKPDAEKAE